jgi:hypothetical protein
MLLLGAHGNALGDLLLIVVLCHYPLGKLRNVSLGTPLRPRTLNGEEVSNVVVVDAVLCKLHSLWPNLHVLLLSTFCSCMSPCMASHGDASTTLAHAHAVVN